MKKTKIIGRILSFASIILILGIFLMPEFAEARRGGGFGGARRSFGGFKRSSPSRSNRAPSSFGGSRRSLSSNRSMSGSGLAGKKPSFGGSRLSSSREYTQKYGVPRKTETLARPGANGMMTNYNVNNYGGFGSGLMTGYMLGHTSWMWSMPFHPAFYYGRPYYVNNPNGTVDVYPPTFSFGRLFFTIIVIGGILYIIFKVVKSRSRANLSRSSFR
ncbi:MAG: hypothetical protein QG635_1037 [Bacteroidota bacterium]|nr:hypothetical protein [Bacteroidota bacterium]